MGRIAYVIDTFLRSSYLYNAFLLPTLMQLVDEDTELGRNAYNTLPKSKDKGIPFKWYLSSRP